MFAIIPQLIYRFSYPPPFPEFDLGSPTVPSVKFQGLARAVPFFVQDLLIFIS